MAKIYFSTAVASPDALTVLDTREELIEIISLQPSILFITVEVTEGVYQTINKNRITRIAD